MWWDIHQLIREIRRAIIFSAINLLNIKKEGFIPLSLDLLSITMYFSFLASLKKHYFIYPEQEKAPVIIFLKIGVWPNAYKKKVDDVREIAILESLLSFKFETFENAEFICLLML